MKFYNYMCRIVKSFLAFNVTLLFLIITGGCDKTDPVTNKAPTCYISSPVDGDELQKGEIKTIYVVAEDTDGCVTEVIFKIDNIEVSYTSVSPFQYQWNTAEADSGLHTINVTVIDNSNNETSREIDIFIIETGSEVLETGTVDDFDGNTYKTVKIGSQWWMSENLRATHFSDGTEIALIDDNESWYNLGFSGKGYCYYNDSLSYAATYGALYNWTTAMNGSESSESAPSNVRGVCPAGWHLPSDNEWIILEMELGMSYEEAWLLGWRGTNEGAKMKTRSGWYSFGNGTNSSGFSALPAGVRNGNGVFTDIGLSTHFWSTTEYFNNPIYSFNRQLDYNQSGVGWFRASHFYGYPKDFGFSVRCIKD